MVVDEFENVEVKNLLAQYERGFVQWLPTTGALRVDATIVAIGRTAQSPVVLSLSDGTTEETWMPTFFTGSGPLLRRALVDPLRGSWTWAHLWMDADELVLHAEFDWMREPLFEQGTQPPSDHACALELDRYPRAEEFIPAWLAEGARRHRLTVPDVDVDVLGLLDRVFPGAGGVDGDGVFEWPGTREGVEERMRQVLGAWLPGTGGQRVEIDCYVLGRYEVLETRLYMRDGTPVVVTLTEPQAWFWGERVREVMVDAVRGAWTHAHLWMKAKDLVLHADYEWDTRPPFLDRMSASEQTHWIHNELTRFPRTPEHTPDWMRT